MAVDNKGKPRADHRRTDLEKLHIDEPAPGLIGHSPAVSGLGRRRDVDGKNAPCTPGGQDDRPGADSQRTSLIPTPGAADTAIFLPAEPQYGHLLQQANALCQRGLLEAAGNLTPCAAAAGQRAGPGAPGELLLLQMPAPVRERNAKLRQLPYPVGSLVGQDPAEGRIAQPSAGLERVLQVDLRIVPVPLTVEGRVDAQSLRGHHIGAAAGLIPAGDGQAHL